MIRHPWYKRERAPKALQQGLKIPRQRIPVEQQPYNKLVSKLDHEVSIFVRRTYQVGEGFGQCYTCKKYFPLKELQAGHFISRKYHVIRFDLRNIRPQCRHCNGALYGAHEKFRYYLVQDIGEDAVKDLEALALAHGERHLPREKLIELLHEFKELNKKWPKGWDV